MSLRACAYGPVPRTVSGVAAGTPSGYSPRKRAVANSGAPRMYGTFSAIRRDVRTIRQAIEGMHAELVLLRRETTQNFDP